MSHTPTTSLSDASLPATHALALPLIARPSVVPTVIPSVSVPPSIVNPVYVLMKSMVCFSNGCATGTSFHLTHGLRELVAARLLVEWKGDIGGISETADLYINGVLSTTCVPGSTVSDCPADFVPCTEFDVLSELGTDKPLTLLIDAASSVDNFCEDKEFADYALRARFTLTFECTHGASRMGCYGATTLARTFTGKLLATSSDGRVYELGTEKTWQLLYYPSGFVLVSKSSRMAHIFIF